MRPQTIQIFLPAGDPRGMRVAEITTRIVRVIEVPRSQLADFIKMPKSQQVGVYFLMGELSEAGLPRAVNLAECQSFSATNRSDFSSIRMKGTRARRCTSMCEEPKVKPNFSSHLWCS